MRIVEDLDRSLVILLTGQRSIGTGGDREYAPDRTARIPDTCQSELSALTAELPQPGYLVDDGHVDIVVR